MKRYCLWRQRKNEKANSCAFHWLVHVVHSNGVMHHTVRACVKQVQRSQPIRPSAFAHFTQTSHGLTDVSVSNHITKRETLQHSFYLQMHAAMSQQFSMNMCALYQSFKLSFTLRYLINIRFDFADVLSTSVPIHICPSI